jgi:hypothetical protein
MVAAMMAFSSMSRRSMSKKKAALRLANGPLRLPLYRRD